MDESAAKTSTVSPNLPLLDRLNKPAPYHPHTCPLFCSSSHVFNGAK